MEKETHFSSTYSIPVCVRDFMYLSNLILLYSQGTGGQEVKELPTGTQPWGWDRRGPAPEPRPGSVEAGGRVPGGEVKGADELGDALGSWAQGKRNSENPSSSGGLLKGMPIGSVGEHKSERRHRPNRSAIA